MWGDRSPLGFQRQQFEDSSCENRYIFSLFKDSTPEHFSTEFMFALFKGHSYKTYSDHFKKQQNSFQQLKTQLHHTCFAMTLVNLMRPEWFMIVCSQPLFTQIFCAKKTVGHGTDILLTTDDKRCMSTNIKKEGRCLQIVFEGSGISDGTKQTHLVYHFKQIKFLTKALRFSPIVQNHIKYKNLSVVYTYISSMETYFMNIVPTNQSPPAYKIYESSKFIFQARSNVFKCILPYFISSMYVCDQNPDCPDKSDERLCKRSSSKIVVNQGRKMPQINFSLVFLLLHFQSKTGKYVKYSNSPSTNQFVQPEQTTCNITKVGVVKEKPNILNITANVGHTRNLCLFLCGFYSEQFCIFELCSYRLNSTGFITPCSNGKHIENCRDFECNIMHKCTNYYCIPWEYVCNGVWDCPLGTEEGEVCGSNYNCTHMYKCKDTALCIHTGSVCDEFANCPHRDDEYLCALKDVQCPLACECLAFAMACLTTTRLLTFPRHEYPHIFVHINNAVVQDSLIFSVFTQVFTLGACEYTS